MLDLCQSKTHFGDPVASETEIFEKLKELLVEKFEVEAASVTREARIYSDLKLDSIDAIELIGEVQSYLNRRIKPQDFKEVRTIQDIVQVTKKIVDGDQSLPHPELKG